MNPSISDKLELCQWLETQSSDDESNCTDLFIHFATFYYILNILCRVLGIQRGIKFMRKNIYSVLDSNLCQKVLRLVEHTMVYTVILHILYC